MKCFATIDSYTHERTAQNNNPLFFAFLIISSNFTPPSVIISGAQHSQPESRNLKHGIRCFISRSDLPCAIILPSKQASPKENPSFIRRMLRALVRALLLMLIETFPCRYSWISDITIDAILKGLLAPFPSNWLDCHNYFDFNFLTIDFPLFRNR